jgi:ferredoxin
LLEELENTREGSRLSCQIRFTEELDGLELEVAPEE